MSPVVEELGRLKREYLGSFLAQNAKRLEIIGGDAPSLGQCKSADRGFPVVQVRRKADEAGELLLGRKIKEGQILRSLQRGRRNHLPLHPCPRVRIPGDCEDLLGGDKPRGRKTKGENSEDLLHPGCGQEIDEAAGIEEKELTFRRLARHA